VNQREVPVLHTNHTLDSDIESDEDEDALMRTYPSSRHRLEVLRRMAPDASSVSQLMPILQNREGFPDSICKAPSEREPTQTAFSLIADCGNRMLHLRPGSPAEHAYRPIMLD
jgi:isopenicillin-N N-acyltransferase like protein